MKTYISLLLQFVIIFSLSIQVYAKGESPDKGDQAEDLDLQLLWEKTEGTTGIEVATSLDQTIDGGYIYAGYTNSTVSGSYDVYLVKVGVAGNKQWERMLGGNKNDWGWSIQQTLDGGFIIAGTTNSFGSGGSDGYLIKAGPSGTMEWYKTYGGSETDEFFSVQQTSDYGYILAGSTESFGFGSSDAFIIKIDSTGQEQWQRTFGGSDIDYAQSIQETSDGGYIICGTTHSFGSNEGYSNILLIKVNSYGHLEWQKTFGESNWADEGNSVWQTRDGGYIVTGSLRMYSAGLLGTWQMGLIKTDKDGNMMWTKEFGGVGKDIGRSVQQTKDRGFIIAGETTSYGAGQEDLYLIKTDPNGDMDWGLTFGGKASDFGCAVQETVEEGFVIAGTTSSFGAGNSDIYMIRLGDYIPVANAGEDQIIYAVFEGVAEIRLDGSNSSDPEGDDLSYRWYWNVGDKTYESNEVSPTIYLPIGVHTIELTVNDGKQNSLPDEVVITVLEAQESFLITYPRPLKRNRGPRRIRARLCLPDGVDEDDVDLDEPVTMYPGGTEAIRQRIRRKRINGIRQPHIFAIFDKVPLMEAIPENGNAEVKVVAKLKDGTSFYGSDTVMIIERVGREWDDGQGDTDNPDDNTGDDTNDGDKDKDDKGDK